jgi:hypothetical protein
MEKVQTLEQMVSEVLSVPYTTYHGKFVQELAKKAAHLIAERENNPGVWDGAPEWATDAGITWSAKTHYSGVYKNYTRELPKTKAREIAERKAREWVDVRISGSQKTLEETIEAAILEALGGEK